MTPLSHLSVCAAFVLAVPMRAQDPLFTMTPAVSIGAGGSQIGWNLTGAIPAPFGLLASLSGTPVDFYGERLYLDRTPMVLLLGAASPGGASGTIAVPAFPGLVGSVVFAQPVLLTASAPNGLFRALGAASSAIHGAPNAIVADLTSPIGDGYQGAYRADVEGHVRGGQVLHRTKDTYDPQHGTLFQAGIQAPLVPTGCREQMVFRPSDLGANGEPELVTAVRWMVGPGLLLEPDTLLQFEMRMGHTAVNPDYSIDPYTWLAVAPASGLSASFANNELPGAPPVLVSFGRYDLDPANLIVGFPGNYLPYPAIVPFAYDGRSSLLLDIRAGQGQHGRNGMQVQLMVQSGPLPAARAVAGGTPFQPLPLPNPGSATLANMIDCAMPILQFDFARAETTARSPWLDSGRATPDYVQPVLATSQPLGTSVTILFRGADTVGGANPTVWSTSQDIADGHRFLQFELHLLGSPVTDDVPLVDTVVVPFY